LGGFLLDAGKVRGLISRGMVRAVFRSRFLRGMGR
jgi:hypothetical protein